MFNQRGSLWLGIIVVLELDEAGTRELNWNRNGKHDYYMLQYLKNILYGGFSHRHKSPPGTMARLFPGISSPSSNAGLPPKGGFASTRVRYQTGSGGENLCTTDLKRHWNTPLEWCLIIKLQFENLSNNCKQRTVNRVVFVKFEPTTCTWPNQKCKFWMTLFLLRWPSVHLSFLGGQNPFYSPAQAKIELNFCVTLCEDTRWKGKKL